MFSSTEGWICQQARTPGLGHGDLVGDGVGPLQAHLPQFGALMLFFVAY
jgi:hypothetical protein